MGSPNQTGGTGRSYDVIQADLATIQKNLVIKGGVTKSAIATTADATKALLDAQTAQTNAELEAQKLEAQRRVLEEEIFNALNITTNINKEIIFDLDKSRVLKSIPARQKNTPFLPANSDLRGIILAPLKTKNPQEIRGSLPEIDGLPSDISSTIEGLRSGNQIEKALAEIQTKLGSNQDILRDVQKQLKAKNGILPTARDVIKIVIRDTLAQGLKSGLTLSAIILLGLIATYLGS